MALVLKLSNKEMNPMRFTIMFAATSENLREELLWYFEAFYGDFEKISERCEKSVK